MQSIISSVAYVALLGSLICLGEASPINSRCGPCDYPCILVNNARGPDGCPVCTCPPPDFPWNTVQDTLTKLRPTAHRPSPPNVGGAITNPASHFTLPKNNAAQVPFAHQFPAPPVFPRNPANPSRIGFFGGPVMSSAVSFATSSEEAELSKPQAGADVDGSECDTPCDWPCTRDPADSCGACSCPSFADLPPRNLAPLVLDYDTSDCPDMDPCPGFCPVGVDEAGCQICGCDDALFSGPEDKKKEKVPFDF